MARFQPGVTDVDVIALDDRRAPHLGHRHLGLPGEQLAHEARSVGMKVRHHDEGHAAVGGHRGEKLLERLEAAGRRAQTDDGEPRTTMGSPAGFSRRPAHAWRCLPRATAGPSGRGAFLRRGDPSHDHRLFPVRVADEGLTGGVPEQRRFVAAVAAKCGAMPVLELPSAPIAYEKTGQGPPVLLLQGVGCIGACWGPRIHGLADRFTLVSVDNRGIGGSGPGTGPLTVEAMADDALAVMDAEGLERFHLVGHSMGGLIAQAIALRARDRLRSLSLLCTFARGGQGARLSPDLLVVGLRTRLGTRAMRRNAFLGLVMPRSFLETRDRDGLAAELGALFGRDLADQPPVVMKQLGAMGRYDAFARLAELGGLPTLVVSATHDRISLPRFGRELAAAISGARFVEIDGAGHGVPIQCAREVNALLAEHFSAADC